MFKTFYSTENNWLIEALTEGVYTEHAGQHLLVALVESAARDIVLTVSIFERSY